MQQYLPYPWHHLTSDQVFDILQSHPDGLSLKEVEARRGYYGYNEIPEVGRRSWIW